MLRGGLTSSVSLQIPVRVLRDSAREFPRALTSFFSRIVVGCARSWSVGRDSRDCTQHYQGLGVLLVPRPGLAHPSSTYTDGC